MIFQLLLFCLNLVLNVLPEACNVQQKFPVSSNWVEPRLELSFLLYLKHDLITLSDRGQANRKILFLFKNGNIKIFVSIFVKYIWKILIWLLLQIKKILRNWKNYDCFSDWHMVTLVRMERMLIPVWPRNPTATQGLSFHTPHTHTGC